jgi:3-dehydro-L-gulonate 2-dehydrogenase
MTDMGQTIRIPQDTMKSEFMRILLNDGFSAERAEQCAEVFTINSLEGVYSHGVNRFPRFVKSIREGYIKPDSVPSIVNRSGSIEQWNGNLGPGPLNAIFATDRSVQLAEENWIGLVGMANTNHWMRAGTYGWRAARKGYVFICWTNTCANMPAWGATDPRLGNNPFVIAVPYENNAVVLDFAMTQFSYGKMESYVNEGRQLPYAGGFDKKGELTTDPGQVLETWRALPTGYWKGSGFSLLLDILAAILSGGLSTHEISCDKKAEYGLSQVFIAIRISGLKNFPVIENTVHQIISDLHKSSPDNLTSEIRYPGENIGKIRNANIKNGIPVNRPIWEKILSL